MTNKKFKMAAMSLALTACVAASPLAANAESAEPADGALPPAAQSEPEAAADVPAEEPTAEPEAPVNEEVEEAPVSQPEAPVEEAQPAAEEAEEAEPVEEAEQPSEETEEEAEEDAPAAEEADKQEPAAEPAEEAPADVQDPTSEIAISRPETAFVTPMLPGAEGAPAASADAQISLMLPMAGEGLAVNAGQASIKGNDDIIYGTLNDAIANAKSDDILLVYEDIESDGIYLKDKNLTIQGVAKTTVAADDTQSTTVKPKLTLKKDGIYLDHSDLTFKGMEIDMTGVVSIPEVDESTWMAIKLNHDSSLTLDNTDMVMDSGADGTDMAHQGIYFAGNGSNTLNVDNDSSLTIKGYYNAIAWNGTKVNPDNTYEINVTDQSSLTLDRNGAGIVGMESLDVLVDNSTLTIINCTDRSGINGANVSIVNGSTANISDNHEGYGIHANDLLVDNSTLIANNNGYGGIRITGKGEFVNGSTVTVTGTEDKGTASIELAVGRNELKNRYLAGSLDVRNSTLNILDNNANGIVCRTRYGLSTSLTIDNASMVTIRNNHAASKNAYNTPKNSPDMGDLGGGLRVEEGSSATLGTNTVINNNHADIAGDDIFVAAGGKLTFSVGNATGNDDILNDDGCGDQIDGWYIDAEGQRWDFHGEQSFVQNLLADGATLTDNGDGTYTITAGADGLALKAAHAELPDPDQPENTDPVLPEDPTDPPVQDATPDTPVMPENPELPPVQDATPDAPVLPSDPVLPAVQDAHALPQTGTSLFAALAMAFSGMILTAAGAWASLTGKRCKH